MRRKTIPWTVVIFSLPLLAISLLRQAPGFYITHLSLGSSIGGIPYSNSVSGRDFDIVWRYPLPIISAVGISLLNFQIDIANSVLSYHVQLNFYNETKGVLNFNPIGLNSDINQLHFSIWLTTVYTDCFEILTVEENAPSWQGSSPNYLFTLQAFTSKFSFGTSQISYRCFLQWVTLISSAITSQKLFIGCSTLSSTSIKVSVTTFDDTNIQSIKISIILLQKAIVSPNIAKFASSTTQNTPTTNDFVTDFGVPDYLFGSPIEDNRCLYGIVRIQMDVGMGIISYLFHFLPTGSVDSFSTLNIEISENRVICFAQCPEGTFIPSTVYTYICEQCQDYMPYCHNCYNSTYCKECQSIAVPDISHASCLLCSSFMQSCRDCDVLTACLICYVGEGVIGGCTDVPGCAEVEQMMTSTGELESYCVRCDDGYSLEGQTCVCDQGESVGLYCTDTAGCVSTVKVNSEVVCVFCNVSAHFQIDSNTHRCLCVDGYEIVGRSCSDVCGDGRVFSSECDDGNTADGDGCSSSCSLETFHKCFNGSQSSPSSCQYVGEDLSITLVDTQRTEGSNQGVFSFAFAPPMPLLSKFNISDYFFFDCSNASFTVSSWAYSDGVATVLVDFQTDLEDRAASVNFTFHQLYIRHSPILLEFTVQSKGVLLVVADTSLKVKVCLYFFKPVSFFSVFLVLVGSFAHQMAGVELVHALQVVYYLHYTTTRYSPALSSLQEMSIVALDDLFLGGTSRNVLVDESLQKIDFSMRSAELTILGVSLFLAVLGSVVLTLWVVFMKCEGSPKTEKAGLCLYRGLLFPLCLSVMLPTFFVALSFARNTSVETLLSDPVRSLLVFTALTTLSLVFFSGFIKLFITTPEESSQHNENVHYFYIPIFEIFIFLEIIIFFFWFSEGQKVECLYILLVFTFLMFILLLKWKPYQQVLNNVGVFANIGLIFCFQVFLVLRGKSILTANQENDIFCLLIIVLIMAVCSVLSLFRVAFAICSALEKNLTQIQTNQHEGIPPTTTLNPTLIQEQEMRNHLKNNFIKPTAHFMSSIGGQGRNAQNNIIWQTVIEKRQKLKLFQQSKIKQFRKKKMYKKRANQEEEQGIREEILK